jgi:hypothetical protein
VTAAALALVAGLAPIATGAAAPRWSPAQLTALAASLAERHPFLESAEARGELATLHRYFDENDYRRLRGNPVLGYWDLNGFRWAGRRATFDVRSVTGCARVTASAWRAALRYAFRKHHLELVAGAPIRFEGACIVAVVEPTRQEPVPGVLLEMRVTGPDGQLRYRFGMGKPTVEDAVGAAADFIVGFAMAAR